MRRAEVTALNQYSGYSGFICVILNCEINGFCQCTCIEARNSCGYTRLLPEVTLWVIALGRDLFGFPVRFIPPVTLQIITRGQLLTWLCF